MVVTRRERWQSCWISLAVPAMWPTLGIQATSKPLGAMCWKGARDCWSRLPGSETGRKSNNKKRKRCSVAVLQFKSNFILDYRK